MDQEFQAVLREHLARYPLMQPQDCAKLAYQSALGPAHTLAEREQVERILQEEMEGAVHLSVPMVAEAKVGKTWYDAKG